MDDKKYSEVIYCKNIMRAIQFLKEANQDSPASLWIDKVYDLYPSMYRDQHLMIWGEDEFVFFKLDEVKSNVVEIAWIQAYPLKSGLGSKAIKILQKLAKEDNINLTLYPWDKGRMSQSLLTKIYKKQGFKPIDNKSKHMIWKHDQT